MNMLPGPVKFSIWKADYPRMARKTKAKVKPNPQELVEATLNVQLEALYTLLSSAAIAGVSEALDNDLALGVSFAEKLTDLAFNAAVVSSLIDPPEGPIAFGEYMVTAEFREDFLKRIQTSILEFRALTADIKDALEFRQPNPATTVRKFCTRNHLNHSTSFVSLIAPQVDNSVCMTTQRRILRLMLVPDIKKHKRPNRSQRNFATHLRDKMAGHDPKRCADLLVDDLLWLPKPEAAG